MKAMKRWAWTIAILALPWTAVPVLARGGSPVVIIGEVVSVHDGVTDNDGRMWNEITVRAEGPEPYRAGELVRARVMAGGPNVDGAYLVRSMVQRRTGARIQYRSAGGELVENGSRVRRQARDGSCDGTAAQSRVRARDGSGGGGNRGGGRGGGRR